MVIILTTLSLRSIITLPIAITQINRLNRLKQIHSILLAWQKTLFLSGKRLKLDPKDTIAKVIET